MSTAMPIAPVRSRNLTKARKITLFGAVLAGAAIFPLSGCNTISSRNHRETRTMVIPHQPDSALSIINANGAVEALSSDRSDVSIEVTLYGNDLERLQFAHVRTERQGDQTLRVWVEWPGGKRQHNEGAAISINLPDTQGVHVRSSNGRITIAGLGGHADLETSNGSITVDTHDGSVHAVTSNGKVQAERISGEVELFTSNGGIVVTDAFGPIRAESSNSNAYVSTMAGNPGPVRVRTSNGNVTLDLGEGFEGVLKCDTSNGKVSVRELNGARLIESSNRSVEMRFGDSSEVSAVRTSNGSVRVQGR